MLFAGLSRAFVGPGAIEKDGTPNGNIVKLY